MRNCLHQGVSLSSAYSGMAGDLVGIRFLEEHMHDIGFLRPGARGTHWVHSGDIDPLCQRVLLACEGWGPDYVTGDLCDRLPTATRQLLDTVCPLSSGDPQYFPDQYAAMLAILQQAEGSSGDKLFNDDTKVMCLKHKMECNVYAPENVRQSDFKMSIGWAGTSCLGVCSPGKKLGPQGPQSKAFLVRVRERRARREQIYFQESTPAFSEQELLKHLHDLYDVFTKVIGPEDFGWWAARPRRFCVLVLKAAGVLIADNDLSSFAEAFFKPRLSMSETPGGHMFWCAPPELVESRFTALSNSRTLSSVPPQQEPSPWFAMLTDAERRSLLRHRNYLRERCLDNAAKRIAKLPPSTTAAATINVKDVLDEADDTICNLRQTPGGVMGHHAMHVPTLLRRSLLWSSRFQRPLLGQEHLLVQGVPTFASKFLPPWVNLVHSLTDQQMRSLAGNSINSMIAGCLTIWALASFMPHEKVALSRMPSGLLSRSMSSDCLWHSPSKPGSSAMSPRPTTAAEHGELLEACAADATTVGAGAVSGAEKAQEERPERQQGQRHKRRRIRGKQPEPQPSRHPEWTE